MTEGNGSGASESGTGMYDCRTLILYIKMYPMGMWMGFFFWFLNARSCACVRACERKDERTNARPTHARAPRSRWTPPGRTVSSNRRASVTRERAENETKATTNRRVEFALEREWQRKENERTK